jgi:NADH:ubiquinone oxidoreductase subunit D
MEIYENVSGARMHTAYTRPVYFNYLMNQTALTKLLHIITTLPITINEIGSILNNNKV